MSDDEFQFRKGAPIRLRRRKPGGVPGRPISIPGKKLCGTRLRLLDLVLEGKARGRMPSLRELCDALGVHLNAVVGHLRALRREGLVAWEDGKARTLVPRARFVPAGEV